MKRKSIWIFVILAAVIVALGVILAPGMKEPFLEKQAADDAFKAFTASLVKQDYRAAYSLSAPAFRANTSLGEFVAENDKLRSDNGALQSAHIDSYTFERNGKGPWIARYETDFIFERKTLTFHCELRKNNGLWQVFGCERV